MDAQDPIYRAMLIEDRKFLLEIAEQSRFAEKQAYRATRAFDALDPATGVEASQKAAAAGSALIRLQTLANAVGIDQRHRSAFLDAVTGNDGAVWDYFDAEAAKLE